jgi:hypothetical protein
VSVSILSVLLCCFTSSSMFPISFVLFEWFEHYFYGTQSCRELLNISKKEGKDEKFLFASSALNLSQEPFEASNAIKYE